MASEDIDSVRLRLVSEGPHPAAGTLAAFVEGRLDVDARYRVIEHLAHCAGCSAAIVAASASKTTRRRRWPTALVTVAITAALVGGPPEPAVASLVRACGELDARPIEGRLTGGFPYKPLRAWSVTPMKLAAAASRIPGTTGDPHASGVAMLLLGDYDGAIATLKDAPESAPVLTDLSAAYHARAKARDFPPDYEAALDTAERAWRLGRTPETAWNRAVAISAFHLTDAARRAWDDVLGTETDREWRAEALARRKALDVATELDEWQRIEPQLARSTDPRSIDAAVRRFPARALVYFDETLLPQWARAQLDGREREASRSLSLGRIMAATLAATGERIAADAVTAIDAACSDASSCRAIALAHARYADGLHLMKNKRPARAAPAFAEAADRFTELRSSYVYAARRQWGECLVHGNRHGDAVRAGEALVADLENRPYRTLHAYARRFLGLAMLHEARPEESIAHYRIAHRLFTEARDFTTVGAVEFLLADAFEFAGDRDEAMKHRLAGLRATQRSGDTTKNRFGLFEAGSSSSWRGWPYAADFLLGESVREALRQQNFLVASMSSFWRSSIAASRADLDVAREQARLARDYWSLTKDPGQRALLGATASQLVPDPETDDAAEKLTAVIRFAEQAGHRAGLPELFRQRALVHEQAGDGDAAEADLRQAIAIAEKVLHEEAPAAMRDGFSSDIRPAYEELIRLLLARGASRDALAVAERARVLWYGPTGDPDALANLNLIPESTAAAVFEVQPDAIVVWLIARKSITTFRWRGRVPLERPEETPSPQTLAALYDVLMKPWIGYVPDGTDLIILPPPSLAGVPFGALWNRETGRAVIDDHGVALAFALASLESEAPALTAADSVLIVGDPAYRQLPHLPRSRREAETIARHYPKRVLLLGDQATAPEVARQLDRADALHFGGHALVNDYAPERSSLMLAADGDGEDARIYVHELLARRKPMKLVVLSACSTARSRSGGARGTMTIARAFLDGGAQAVVGTLWPVSDDAAAVFSTRLHDELARGLSVTRAVRSAQLHLRSTTTGDSTWAAFCVLRGNAAAAGG